MVFMCKTDENKDFALDDKRFDMGDMNDIWYYFEEDVAQKIQEFKKELFKRINMNGNLSFRIVEVADGEFSHIHDKILNNIVIEVIEEELIKHFGTLAGENKDGA